jgi:rare lipoprotein A
MRALSACLLFVVCALLATPDVARADWRAHILGTDGWSYRAPERTASSSTTGKTRPATRSRTRTVAATFDDESRPQRRRRGKSFSSARVAASAGGGGSSGLASYYWQPQRVASGGWFNPNALTAAHRTLPFGTRVRVTNKRNGRSVVVTINDRGPFIAGRVIDLSSRAAGVIGMKQAGVVPVAVSVIGR